MIDGINVLYQEYRHLKRETSKKSCSAVKKKRMRAKMEKNHQNMIELISSFKLEKGQLDNMVDKLLEKRGN